MVERMRNARVILFLINIVESYVTWENTASPRPILAKVFVCNEVKLHKPSVLQGRSVHVQGGFPEHLAKQARAEHLCENLYQQAEKVLKPLTDHAIPGRSNRVGVESRGEEKGRQLSGCQ